MSFDKILRAELERTEVEIADSAVRNLVRYCDELERWNKKVNLTALQGAALARRLVVEPCWIAQKLGIAGVMWDIGSGNGSPAIPIGLTAKLESLHLIEVRAKRAAFLRHVTTALEMKHVKVHRARFEDTAAMLGPVDWVTLQAVEPAESILNALKSASLSPPPRVVWITSKRKAPQTGANSVLELPNSDTIAVISNLDHS